eukprot:EC800024.1.p1 GENE.EC800024.1~~EC800024.1.p1  ORF type:complete len:221 (+),score=33.80 EC800024.1:51-713(+)
MSAPSLWWPCGRRPRRFVVGLHCCKGQRKEGDLCQCHLGGAGVPQPPRLERQPPGFWFGIEPVPADLLIQPILAYGDTGNFPPRYSIFNGYFDWLNGQWWQSDDSIVEPGMHVFGSITYQTDNSYTMHIECKETGWHIDSNIPVDPSDKIFTDVYFVIEHQPNSCKDYPKNGNVTFTDIHIEWEGKEATPSWTGAQYKPACNSQAHVVSPSSVYFTWNTQ